MAEMNEALLTEITERIVAVSDPQQIILFGSQARGDARSDSDLDLLVVKEEMESPRAEAARIYRALAGLSIPVDIVIARSDYVRRHRDVVGTVVRPALREGRVLYVR
ncbi:MAG: nucleotidyltransferase domain-containing protein [Anaerolineae bacterium]|jgi:predicted nucleotidyltransferase|nr:nucleotidyltransferase domain-containing protein [Anaerolineae bacterium]